MDGSILSWAGAILWAGVLLAPWRPWSTRDALNSRGPTPDEDLSEITVLIPARNEAGLLQTTLPCLQSQGRGLRIVLVDDQSSDETAAVARGMAVPELKVIHGAPPPEGWSGKLWALQQGFAHCRTPLTLLLDADIALSPGILSTARELMRGKGLHLLSLMASLRMERFWERLLMPSFVYFFMLLYPFRLSNTKGRRTAAAAGGFILLDTERLREAGGFEPLRGALIDDCALAARIKTGGGRTWIGLTHSVRSLRACPNLGSIWNMVARTAFTQLRYSLLLLLLCSALLAVAFWSPVAGLCLGPAGLRAISALALALMVTSYLPTLRFFGLSRCWAIGLPLVGTLYLLMTWTSAVRYWRGRRSEWKGRVYGRVSGKG